MSVAAIDFDPYRDWLKIQDETRPLNPYQLLRLVVLETDLVKIRAAYHRQVEILDTRFGKGDDQLLRALQEELLQAVDTLTDPERKGVVDGEIRRRTMA